jgi:histidine triad (HIT) family protein
MSVQPSNNCVFCQIAAGQKAAEVVYEDETAIAFWDAHPKAPIHILIIPRRHISSVNVVEPEDEAELGHLFSVARRIAEMQGIEANGYRLVTNTGEEGGQTVFHLHMHLLGGRHLGRY